ncbi:MAG TPA: hypothetical protein VGL24_06015 [Chthoniobacterales bacterium]|jgi:hypothetical protein
MDFDELVRVMEVAILERGFYFLMDERLDLICGPGCSKDPANSKNLQRVQKFAAERGWKVQLEDHWYSFSRD